MRKNAYFRDFEFMFVFSNGKPRTANLLEDKPNYKSGHRITDRSAGRTGDARMQVFDNLRAIPAKGRRRSIWRYSLI